MAKAATTLRKLLLVRKEHVRHDLLRDTGFLSFVKGEPMKVLPETWPEEAELSHAAFLLDGMKLDDLKKVREWVAKNPEHTLLDFEKDDTGPDDVLKRVGLRTNPVA